MIEAKASGDKTYAKVAGTGRDIMLETGMLPEMTERLIHNTASCGIEMAKKDKEND